MTQPQHDDPFGEARQQMLQILAVAATVGEAAARWAAVSIQNRAVQTEQQNAAEEANRAAQRLATNEQNQHDRTLIDKGFTDWLSRATLDDTVRLWRTATVHAAAGNTRAAEAVGLAQERLRKMNGPLMDAYDRNRASGMGQAEAMRAAAYEMWDTETRYPPPPGARPHGGTRQAEQLRAGANGKALGPGGPALDELDAAVRAEAGRLAAHVSPEALDRLQREWRLAGQAPAADAAGLLLQVARDAIDQGAMTPAAADALAASLHAQADTEQRAAALDNAEPDNPATGNADEHQQGQAQGQEHTDLAADLAAAGDRQRALMTRTFPRLTDIGGLPAHVNAKQPATTTPAQRKTRTR